MSKTDQVSVLVVDDNPTNLQLVSTQLLRIGIEVSIATSGFDALSIVEQENPALVLLDVNMPKMDGYETCRRIKQMPSAVDIPVIFISALDREYDKLKGFEAGAVDYVAKPIQLQELCARVAVHLELAEKRTQLTEKSHLLKNLNNVLMEREMRVIELKKEVNQMAKRFDQPEPYKGIE